MPHQEPAWKVARVDLRIRQRDQQTSNCLVYELIAELILAGGDLPVCGLTKRKISTASGTKISWSSLYGLLLRIRPGRDPPAGLRALQSNRKSR